MGSFCELFGAATVKSFSSENQIKLPEWAGYSFSSSLARWCLARLLASVNSRALHLLRYFICKFVLMMSYTHEREMCALCAICLAEWWLCGRSSWLCTQAHKQTRHSQHYALTVVDHYRQWRSKQPNLSIFSSKWFKPLRHHFLFGNSLRKSRAV